MNLRLHYRRFIHNSLVHPLIGFFGERKWIMSKHNNTGRKWEALEIVDKQKGFDDFLVDLYHKCKSLRDNRIDELSLKLPKVAVTAIGGFPILKEEGVFTWCGSTITVQMLHDRILEALGLSATLTYTNKSNKSLLDLGKLCLDKHHLWGAHWINLTIVFARFPLNVEMSFARDKRFYISWPVEKEPTGKVFTATTGLKEWLDYTSHKEDLSFNKDTREAMLGAYNVIQRLL